VLCCVGFGERGEGGGEAGGDGQALSIFCVVAILHMTASCVSGSSMECRRWRGTGGGRTLSDTPISPVGISLAGRIY